jgi:hypothetical protein
MMRGKKSGSIVLPIVHSSLVADVHRSYLVGRLASSVARLDCCLLLVGTCKRAFVQSSKERASLRKESFIEVLRARTCVLLVWPRSTGPLKIACSRSHSMRSRRSEPIPMPDPYGHRLTASIIQSKSAINDPATVVMVSR